jgi:hypothetical protein
MSVVTPHQQYPSHSYDYRPCGVRELRHFIQEHTTPALGDKYRKLNKAKRVFHLRKLDAAAADTLDYRSCDVGELYSFVKNRTVPTVVAAIQTLNKAEMVTHLKTLDTQRTFSCFMDLPPELRLDIYQRLLLIDGKQDGKNHSALLRVSKLIHRESEPLLYCDNTFSVYVNHYTIKLVISESSATNWNTWERLPTLAAPIRVDMLLGLKILTVRLGLTHDDVIPLPSGHGHFNVIVQNGLANVCLVLSSASRFKRLNLTNILPQGNSWSDDKLLELLSPILLLPETVEVRLEGVSLALHTALEDSRRNIHLLPNRTIIACGTLLSRAMHVKRRHNQNKVSDFNMDHVEEMLHALLRHSDWIGKSGVKNDGFEANLQHLEEYVTLAEEELAVLRH